jgi:antirestriction protein ArdC
MKINNDENRTLGVAAAEAMKIEGYLLEVETGAL